MPEPVFRITFSFASLALILSANVRGGPFAALSPQVALRLRSAAPEPRITMWRNTPGPSKLACLSTPDQ